MPRVGASNRQSADEEGRGAMPLVTQFAVPSAPFGMVERPRLRERLGSGLAEPVTLVCAPAGSGKTALVASVAASLREPVAWVSLEPEDDKPHRLWNTVLEAIERAGAAPQDSALAALAAPVPESRDAFMPRLVNALAALPHPLVLVLDDVHVVRSRECVAQLSFLLLHAPDRLRLVLVARADPALPLHVLRVSGRMVEVRAADLAFTPEETDEVLRAHGVGLTEAQLLVLHARTEGWAAGLRLAALTLQGHDDPDRFLADFAGDDRVVGDYLLAEVLDRQPPRLRAFCLRTAVVDRVSGSLADALTGQGHGADTLVELERTNGFVIGLDGRREWFRYHRLFGRLLRSRAERELADEVEELHARAARWLAEHGAAAEALPHAVAAREWDLALALLAEHWFELYVRGDGPALRALVAELPADRLAADAEASAALTCAALEDGDRAAAAAHRADAEAAAPSLPEPRRRRYLETMALARLEAARLDGDFRAALAAADELLAEAAAQPGPPDHGRQAVVHAMLGDAAQWSHALERAAHELGSAVALARAEGLDFVAVGALSSLGLLDVMSQGPACDTVHAREAIELAERRGWSGIPQTACAHLALALAAFSDLCPGEAAEHLARASAAAERVRRRGLDFVIAVLAARLEAEAGSPRDGLRHLDTFEALHRYGEAPDYERPTLAARRAGLLAASGELEAAEAALADVRGEPWLAVGLTDAKLRLAQGEPADALAILEVADTQFESHAGMTVERAVLEAVARDELDEPQRAVAALEQALELAEATRHRGPFLEAGRRMDAMLRRQIRQGTAHRALVGDLLDRLADRAPAARNAAPLLEPLSRREEAILRYLPTALSNREIAAELFVTTNTVKTHLRSIYRKLDVARRRDAVDRGRELRLLSSGLGR
jgi:LuxR family transcriptional regulator, maltose regulon positive regulatory protein